MADGIVVHDSYKSPIKKVGNKTVVRLAPQKPQTQSVVLCTDCSHNGVDHALIGLGTCDGDEGRCPCIRFRFPANQK